MKNNKITNFIIRNPYWSTLFFPFVPIIILILLFIYTDSTNPYGLVTTTTATPNPFLQIISNIWSITAPYIFLFGIPLLPPLAGIKATIFFFLLFDMLYFIEN